MLIDNDAANNHNNNNNNNDNNDNNDTNNDLSDSTSPLAALQKRGGCRGGTCRRSAWIYTLADVVGLVRQVMLGTVSVRRLRETYERAILAR